MRENIKEHIEELKEVVLELHRSAANLDEYIQMLEMELGNPVLENKYADMLTKRYQTYRMVYKHDRGFNKLDEKENDIWMQLIASVNEEGAQ